MQQLYTAAQCRELDRLAIAGGQPGMELMRRAGQAVFDQLLSQWPDLVRLTICCGKGNNAGDGYVIAGLAVGYGIAVELLQIGDPQALQGDAASARDEALALGLEVIRTDDGCFMPNGQVIVDALLGTGLKGPVHGPYAALIERMNSTGRPILAVDVPSGVAADTGAVQSVAIRAELTVTFIGRKIGLHTGTGAELAGRVQYAGLGVGREIHRQVQGLDWLDFEAVRAAHPLPRRGPGSYKQALGHVVVVGGDESMGGAPLMAAEAALRSGAGMVSVVTRAIHRNAMLARRPELMVVDADSSSATEAVFERGTLLVVGPGLGREAWGEALLAKTLELSRPMVLDADGLFLLAASGAIPAAQVIVTPHTGEAATLLGSSVAEVHNDRIQAVCALADRVAGVAVLKGAGSLIGSARQGLPRCLGLCSHGNPGMASAGMGDVLAGIVGGLFAQGLEPEAAALLGVCLHSLAADRAAVRLGEASLLATDLLPELAELLKVRAVLRPSAAAGSADVPS